MFKVVYRRKAIKMLGKEVEKARARARETDSEWDWGILSGLMKAKIAVEAMK